MSGGTGGDRDTGAPATLAVPSGYRIGRWEVRELLASGAFGSVYAARATESGNGLPDRAALKIMSTGTRTPRQLSHLKELARRELDVHRRLQQPRLIRMFEALTVDDPERPGLDGATVLVLERADGSVDQLLRRCAPAPPPAAPALLAQICEGLAQLHHAGWVHGDLKPGNVLLMADGSVRLGDFNLAAEMDGTHAYAPAFATADYTPPELLWSQISEQGRQIRPTADIWAFGVLAHLLLTGTLPLPGGSPSVRRDALLRYARGDDELRLSAELPDAWRQIVTDCLARTHERRAAHDARSLLRRVEAAAGTDRSPRLPRLRPRRVRRRAWAALAATAALVAGGGAYALQDRAAPPTDPAHYGASELRTDRGVPVAYRKLIVDAAHKCVNSAVSPALMAAMLKAESGFDPDLADPAKDEYGIARWTPRVLYYWLPDDKRPAKEAALKPPFSPEVSIPAMGRYLCDISRSLRRDLPGDRRLAIAAGYRTSAAKVNLASGVPPTQRAYVSKVSTQLKRYAPAALSYTAAVSRNLKDLTPGGG